MPRRGFGRRCGGRTRVSEAAAGRPRRVAGPRPRSPADARGIGSGPVVRRRGRRGPAPVFSGRPGPGPSKPPAGLEGETAEGPGGSQTVRRRRDPAPRAAEAPHEVGQPDGRRRHVPGPHGSEPRLRMVALRVEDLREVGRRRQGLVQDGRQEGLAAAAREGGGHRRWQHHDAQPSRRLEAVLDVPRAQVDGQRRRRAAEEDGPDAQVVDDAEAVVPPDDDDGQRSGVERPTVSVLRYERRRGPDRAPDVRGIAADGAGPRRTPEARPPPNVTPDDVLGMADHMDGQARRVEAEAVRRVVPDGVIRALDREAGRTPLGV